MSFRLLQANIVILADAFNPSIASKDWLRDNVVHEEPSNFVNTPLVSVFETPTLHLLVDQSRFQATCKDVSEKTLEQCSRLAELYVKTLPHTPYKALGFNFVWELVLEASSKSSVAHRGNCTLEKNGLDAEFETYVVEPTVLGRMGEVLVRITVEPSIEANRPIVTSVNFHHHYSDAALIAKTVGQLTVRADDSERLVRILLGVDSE